MDRAVAIDLTRPCVDWKGRLTDKGYGRLGGQLAHRLAYVNAIGPIPKGLELDHLCRNKRCVNPAHLEAVTRAEHARRQPSATKPACIHGHPFDTRNTYPRNGSGGGQRGCRTCNLAAVHRYKGRRNAA